MIATKNKTLERYIIKETCSPKYLFYKQENNFMKGLKMHTKIKEFNIQVKRNLKK